MGCLVQLRVELQKLDVVLHVHNPELAKALSGQLKKVSKKSTNGKGKYDDDDDEQYSLITRNEGTPYAKSTKLTAEALAANRTSGGGASTVPVTVSLLKSNDSSDRFIGIIIIIIINTILITTIIIVIITISIMHNVRLRG
jgi:hypothetical protein